MLNRVRVGHRPPVDLDGDVTAAEQVDLIVRRDRDGGEPAQQLNAVLLLGMRSLLHLIRAPVDLQYLVGTYAHDLDHVRLIWLDDCGRIGGEHGVHP